ncbi:MAG TPA: DUF1127 domain-containing protein [Acetobacteraceae bacterium]|nr:DUF1127 domain-containing protein [Acetobacteraceae bacterium]
MTSQFLAASFLMAAGQPFIPGRQARVSMWGKIQEAWRRHRSRQSLAQLDARLLRDIGVTFAEAEEEMNKPFWRA